MGRKSKTTGSDGFADGGQIRDPAITRVLLYWICVTALLAVALLAGVAIGSSHIASESVIRVMGAHVLPRDWVDLSGIPEPEQVIVWLVRVPRVLIAACVGASLAVAGAAMQGLFRNPLASPDVIGCSAGGALGAVVALASGLAMKSLFYLPVLSFAGSLIALFVVYAIATSRGRTPITTLLLAGVALNSLIGAVTSFLISVRWVRYEIAQEILFWLMGGLDSRTWEHVWLVVPCLVVGLAITLLYSRDLDVLLLGEDAALAVGTDVERVKRTVITSAALLTGGAVAVSGVIGFVGLVVPHVVRLMIGPSHRYLLPASALTGAAFLILADLLARTLLRPEEIRLGIITAVFGAPFFLYLLIRRQRASEIF
jgi:iron complex transport system permease protein